jgi:hypothetical protein
VLRDLRALLDKVGSAYESPANQTGQVTQAVERLVKDLLAGLQRQGVVQADSLASCPWHLVDVAGWIHEASTSTAYSQSDRNRALTACFDALWASCAVHDRCRSSRAATPATHSNAPGEHNHLV